MQFITTSQLTKIQKEKIQQLWNDEYPVTLKHQQISDFETYLGNLKEVFHVLLVSENQDIKGWYCDFTRENEKWFAMIVCSNAQGKGYGSKLLNLAKQKETVLHGWVVDHNDYKKQNGEVYKSPLKFYEKNGFHIIENSSTQLGKISVLKIRWSSFQSSEI